MVWSEEKKIEQTTTKWESPGLWFTLADDVFQTLLKV